MCDLTAVAEARVPPVGCQAQVAAGPVLVAAQFQGLSGLHTLGDGVAFAFYHHAARVGVTDERYQGGFVAAGPLREGWEQSGQRCRLGLTKDEELRPATKDIPW